MISVLDVAKYFVQKEGTEGTITQLKLQKLCYYAQGFHLAIYQIPLFSENIEAWKHGPVMTALRTPLSCKGGETIRSHDLPLAIPILSDEITNFLDKVWDKFGHYKAGVLVNMTHAEPPWNEAYKIGQNTQLSNISMQTYFTTRKNELIKSEISDACGEDSFTVFLKDGNVVKVPDSAFEAFVQENSHLIEPRKINNARRRTDIYT